MQRTKIFNAVIGLIVLIEYVGLALWAKSALAEASSYKDKENLFAGLSFWMGVEFVVTATLSLIFAFVARLYLARKIAQDSVGATAWILVAMLLSPPLGIGLLNGAMSSGRASSNEVLVAKYFGGLIFPYALVIVLAGLSKRKSVN